MSYSPSKTLQIELEGKTYQRYGSEEDHKQGTRQAHAHFARRGTKRDLVRVGQVVPNMILCRNLKPKSSTPDSEVKLKVIAKLLYTT